MALSLAGLPPALLFASALIMAAAPAPTVDSQATAERTSASNAPPVELSDRDAVSAHTHAQLGYDYARQGNRDGAVAELEKAERQSRSLGSEDINVERLICLAYAALDEGSLAAAHYERITQLANRAVKRGVDPAAGERLQQIWLECRAKLPPVFFTNPAPRDYTGSDWTRALREKLAGDEELVVVNPLASTPEMISRAHGWTAAATNDFQRAKMLYDALAGRATSLPASFRRPPTAQEVFAAWNTPGASFHCQEFAFLYVALARAAGLKAYHAIVEEDCHGMKLSHACAAVFLGRSMLLVDLSYSLFGAPHKRFNVLDDLQSAAIYLCRSQKRETCQIAAKLAPDLSIVQASLFESFARDGRWQEARDQMAAMIRLNPEWPQTHSARAEIAFQGGRPEEAIELLRKAIEAAPLTDFLYVMLGYIYGRQGKWSEARESYQSAILYATYESGAQEARQAIAFIDAQQYQTKGDWEGALTNYEEALRLEPDSAEAHSNRGAAKQARGDLAGALADYNKAVELKRDLSEAYFNRGALMQVKGDVNRAVADYTTAISLKPDLWEAFVARGSANEARSDWDAVVRDYTRAIELKPGSADAYHKRATARQNTGDLKGALADYDKALELMPEFVTVYRSRAVLHYHRREFREALADFRKVSETGLSDDYNQFRIWMIRSRLGDATGAVKELQDYLDSRKLDMADNWHWKLGQFLTGRIKEPELFKAAESPDTRTDTERHCEAWFYAGTKRLLAGDQASASKYFENCVATHMEALIEYGSAVHELRFLKAGRGGE